MPLDPNQPRFDFDQAASILLIWIKNYFDSDQLDHRWGYDPAEQVDSDQLFPHVFLQRMLIDGARCGRFTCPNTRKSSLLRDVWFLL